MIYKNHQAQISQILETRLREVHLSQINFLKCYAFKLQKIYKNYREELLCVLWLLNFMSVVGHNIVHTISHFLLEVLRGRYS